MRDIRIAMAICQATVGRIEENLARVLYWTAKARNAGAELICFPELSLTGYANRPEMASHALTTDHSVAARISQAAADARMVILAGMAEVNPAGSPYASHCVYWPDGRIEIYRKLHLAPPERGFFTPGSTIPVFRHPAMSFGIQLCYDAHFPELTTAMVQRGVQVLFIAHASPRGDARTKHLSWMRHLPARAFDNGIFVAACNQWGDNGTGLNFPGNAVVLAPGGTIAAKKVTAGEDLLIADLKASDLTAVREHPMRYFFPNRRPELYD